MPYTVNWYIENEVIYVHYSGAATTEMMRDSMATMQAMIENSPRHMVHTITDVGDITKPMNPKDALENARDMAPNARTGWTIVLREKSVVVKVGVMVGASVFKTRVKSCSTTADAIACLKEIDPELSWDRADPSIFATQ
ncbi:MAG: hypothetical protein R3E39_23540 [Anaerolineae bacterium]